MWVMGMNGDISPVVSRATAEAAGNVEISLAFIHPFSRCLQLLLLCVYEASVGNAFV